MWPLGDAAALEEFVACLGVDVVVVVEGDFKSVILATAAVDGDCFVDVVNGGVMAPGVDIVGLAFVDPTTDAAVFLVVLGAVVVDLGVFSLVPDAFAIERAAFVGATGTTDATVGTGAASVVDAEDAGRGAETCSVVVHDPAEVGGVDSNDAGVEFTSVAVVVIAEVEFTIATGFIAVVAGVAPVSLVVVLLDTAIVAVDVTVGVPVGVVVVVVVVLAGVSLSFSFSVPVLSAALVLGFKLVALI